MIVCIDPSYPPLYRGDEIEVPDAARFLRCLTCEEKGNRNTVLCRAHVQEGSVIEIKCPRCKTMQRFRT